jgi:sigma-B regulation protein RsbU (phosphoserine phosphatase)
MLARDVMNETPVQLLLVDDNPLDAALVQRMLQQVSKDFPVQTRWVDSAVKAVGEILNRQYELMLLDYSMPDGSGLTVLNAVRKLPQIQQPAVVMLTASGSERVAVETLKHGARDYLHKDELSHGELTRALMLALTQKRMQDQLSRYLAQTEADLKMAQQLQRALLPQRFPTFPPRVAPVESALRFHARYVTTAELGGDFYDVLRIFDMTAGVFLCDVMGHGVRAALVTAMIRALLQEARHVVGDPTQFLTALNTGLVEILKNTPDPLFATASYIVVDAAQGRIRYANAGHPWPWHLRAGGAVESLSEPRCGGPALGVFETASFPTVERPISPGDMLVLLTDGLFEVQGANEEEFGEHRVEEVLREFSKKEPPVLLDNLVNTARLFSARGEFDDDVCVLGVEVSHLREAATEELPP